MSQRHNRPDHNTASTSMHWPVVWGALLTLGFYVMIQKSVIDNPWITRYFASHPVEYITTTMFFVGLAALWLKGRQLKHEPDEPETLIDAVVGDSEPEGAPVSEAAAMLERLLDKGADHRKSFLVRRLHESLGFLDRTRSVDGLDDQLRNLTDTDEVRSHESYSLIRVIISTIPILGFLGTVVGITKAVAQLAQIVGELSFEEAINSVVSGLSVAFDTTALALGLSIVLIFSMFFTSRREMGILSRVERLVSDALVGRFRAADAETDPAVDAVQKMSSELVRKTDKLVQRQAEIWQESLDQSHERWTTMAVTSERQLETALTRALQNSLQAHAAKLEESEAKAEQRVGRYWQEMLTMMENSTQTLDAQYDELRRQGSVMQQAVDATARVIQLEDALNHNLSALRESNHFDETVNSLAAAINLLNAKLGDTNPPEVKLRSESTGRAA